MSHAHTRADRSILRRQSVPMAYLWKLVFENGTEKNITLHDQTLSRHGEPYYQPQPGLEGFSIRKDSGLTSQTTELSGAYQPGGPGLEYLDFRTRKVDHALAYCTQVNWEYPFHGNGVARHLFSVHGVDYDEHRWTLQLAGLGERLNNKRGETYSPLCINELGIVEEPVSFCHYDPSQYPDTVGECGVAVSPTPNRRTFEIFRFVTNPLQSSTHVKDFFSHGYIEWTTGANAGLTESIESSDIGQSQNHQVLTMQRPLPFTPVGDNDGCIVVVGCDKTEAECTNKFNQFQVSFRGAPHLPGQLSSLRSPAAE